MDGKINCKIHDVGLAESLKVVRETLNAIRTKINCMEALPEKSSKYEQSMIESIYGMLTSQSHLLQYLYYHAKSSDEILDVKKTQELVKQTCFELEELKGRNINS